MPVKFKRGTAHGPQVEVPIAKDITSDPAVVAVDLNFDENGRIADTATAQELGRRGGLAKARRGRIVSHLGLKEIGEDKEFYLYAREAEKFVENAIFELGEVCAGYVCAAACTILASAGIQLAASRLCSDKGAQTGDLTLFKMASELANASRQNLLAAQDVAVKMALKHLGPGAGIDPLAAFDTTIDENGEPVKNKNKGRGAKKPKI